MSSQEIAPLLPHLRRYARALTGSQAAGDGLVRMTLEALVQRELTLEQHLGARVALYRAFHRVCGAPEVDPLARGEWSPQARLQGLSPAPRQALLLSVVEGFSFQQVGQILQVSPARAQALAEDAQVEIERGLVTDVLVIEDEAVIAMDIKDLAEELGHSVYAIARTHAEALDEVARKPPGLVLADIKLADESSGVDAVHDILANFDAPVVFVTAYPERLLTGEKPEPTYLVTKPFDRAVLKATIGQALFFHRPRGEA